MKLLHFLVPLLLTGCAAQAADHARSSEGYRLLGRYEEASGGGQTFAWPASGIEGRFVGAQLVAHIEESGSSLMDLNLDGTMTQLQLQSGAHDYTLFSTPGAGEHYVRLTRRSEVGSGLTTIRSLTLTGEWRAPPARAHRILFIGDSITVGYGAAGADEHCRYSPETSPPFDSYAARTAAAFDADFEVIAISGRGVVRNYDGFEAPHMSELIDAALPDHPETHWDAAKFSPELIVINLGANDFSTADPGPTFEPVYLAMLRALHTRYPNARIVTAFGPENRTQDAIPRITAITAAYNREASAPISFIYLPRAESGRIFGCDYHPGEDTHALMARTLEDKIARDLGWRVVH